MKSNRRVMYEVKKIFTFGFITLLIALFLFGYLKPNRTYNDLSAMENKIAKELDASQVSIFDTQEKDEYRIVGYTADSILGFAYFELNEDEDYEYVFVKSRNEMRSVADHIYHDFMSPHEVFLSNNEALHNNQTKNHVQIGVFRS